MKNSPSTDDRAVRPATNASISGVIVGADQDLAIVSVELPSGQRHVIRPAPTQADLSARVWSTGGPDRAGRVAFVDNDMLNKSHTLKLINYDGSGERTIFQHAGDAIWQHAIGRHLALAPAGDKVALVAQTHGVQMPRALLQEGALQIWDTAAGTSVEIGLALDQGLSWSPDERHIACVRLVARSELPVAEPLTDGFGELFAKWDRVPAICLVDLQTRQQRILGPGVTPILSTDGRALLTSDLPSGDGRHWRLLNIETSISRFLPNSTNRIYIALTPTQQALYLATPSPGDQTGQTKFFSPLRGPMDLLALKIGSPDDLHGTTRIAGFDPRLGLTFSPIAPNPASLQH